KVYFHSKTYYTDPATSTIKNSTSETFIIPGSITTDNVDGWPGKAPNRNTIKTGLYLRKRVDESLVPAAGGQSSTDFMVFRYGEILLNYAEAAFELNMPAVAIDAINQIRTRAQMPARITLTENQIRQERRVELAFEEHSYWDLRRWRIAESVLNGKRFLGIKYEYDFDKKKYLFVTVNAEGASRIFQPKHYYLPLGISTIADNSNLVENPDYNN
ncbi:MAG: RagB/SusD family nutrient uptake outer membrane protein, partial [Niabella sp.]